MYEKMKTLILNNAYTVVEARDTLNSLLFSNQLTPAQFDELYAMIPDLPLTSAELEEKMQNEGIARRIETLEEQMQKVLALLEAPTEPEAPEQGTIDNPIPAASGMIYYREKYYSEGGKIYLCTRDTEIEIAYVPSQLIGIYFAEAADENERH